MLLLIHNNSITMKRIVSIFFMVLLLTPCFAQKQKVGIVLSGGGALGFAHIGALQALNEAGIYPTIIAGTSMGALMGAMYADGMTPQEMYKVIKKYKMDKVGTIITPAVRSQSLGFANPKNMNKMMREVLPHNNFDSLKYPMYICVANLNTGAPEFGHRGKYLHEYMLASSAIPGLFEAVEINHNYYVDGGLFNNFPAEAIRKQCTYLIGVDCNPRHANVSIHSTKDIALRCVTVLVQNNSIPGREMVDYLIESPANALYKSLDFDKFETIYTFGYEATKKYLSKHPEMVKKLAVKK